MSFVVVDVESDGPIPGDYSMLEFGAVIVTPELNKTFYGQCAPLPNANYNEDTVKWLREKAGINREETHNYPNPKETFIRFNDWLEENKDKKERLIFISDNLAFDWMFICWYFHHFLSFNPFSYSGRRIGDLYCGLAKDTRARWKQHRKTIHSHNPVDDAKGNAEAIIYMKEKMGLKINLK